MNLKDAQRLKTGTLVREAYRPDSCSHPIHGIVIGKKHVKVRHYAKVLSQWKEQRYDIVVHWLCKEKAIPSLSWKETPKRLQVRENWELMVVSREVS